MIGQIIFRNELSKGRQYDRRVREDLRLPCGRHTEHGLPHHGQSESWGAGKGGDGGSEAESEAGSGEHSGEQRVGIADGRVGAVV